MSWSGDSTRLTFKLREGVKWHDGRPFTAADVKCTWDLLTGRAAERLRLNPRKSWWGNVAEIATDDPTEATFVLKRPQPAICSQGRDSRGSRGRRPAGRGAGLWADRDTPAAL